VPEVLFSDARDREFNGNSDVVADHKASVKLWRLGARTQGEAIK
jgi:hypothetical protein